jgi:hypothetical protein
MKQQNVRYERSDAQVGTVCACGAGLALAVLVVCLVAAGLFDAFKASAQRQDTPLPTLAAQERLQLPRDVRKIPAPVLQENEPIDLERLRETEERRLISYGWVDAKAGIVHIPIAEAMRLLADPKIAEAHGIRVDAKKGGR